MLVYFLNVFPMNLKVRWRHTNFHRYETGRQTPAHKKVNCFEKNNYWLVSILPNISEVFERCLHNQVSRFVNIFSKYPCSFWKSHDS